MQRRSLLSLAVLLPVPLLAARFGGARSGQRKSSDLQGDAVELNDLATSIHSPADARTFVDRIAGIFADSLPCAWTTRGFRDRIAQAEFASATDPSHGILEVRIAAAWNRYIDTLGAPENAHVTAPELHNQRDALFATARVFWTRPYKSIWTIPGIYATTSEGTLAPNCRVIESVRLLWDFANIPDSIQNARERDRKGILVSDLLRETAHHPSTSLSSAGYSRVEGRVVAKPVEAAAWQYMQQHGVPAFTGVVGALLNELLS